MPVNKADIAIAKPKATGALWTDVATAALPVDASTALPATAASLGYVSAEGISSQLEVSETDIEEMGGDVVMTVVDSTKETINLELLQISADTLKELYGATNVTETANLITVKHQSIDLPVRRFYVELLLTGGRIMRKVIHAGKVSQSHTMQFKKGTPITIPVEIKCLPDANGVRVTDYITKVAP